MPNVTKDGSCLEFSKEQPYRQDAFICIVDRTAYDPCFSNEKKDQVVCHMNPLSQDVFIINLKAPLPDLKSQVVLRTNWAWFLELEDGALLSPYINRPKINEEIAFYGSSILNDKRTVIIGDLIIGEIWTARKKVLILDANKKWVVESSEIAKVKNVWQ